MTDEEIESVSMEVAQSTEPAQLSDRQDDAQQQADSRRTDAEYNWGETRRKLDQLERKTREQEDMINRLQRPQQPPEEDFSNLDDDDIITVKQHKNMSAKIARQVAEEVVRQRDAATVDDRLRLKYSDYDQVVTVANIDLLKQSDPELALSLQRLSDDPYAQSVAAYKILKKTGHSTTVPQSLEKRKASENAQKPVSINAVSKSSAIGNASLFENGLTKELKAQLWKQMQQDIENG